MKDDAANIVTGILIHGEIQRRNEEIRIQQEYKNRKLNEENEKLQKKQSNIEKQQKQIKEANAILDDDARRLRINNRALFNKAQELQNEVVEYQILLCKPMQEIANKNGDFKKTYEKQMELMAEWMLSQKAFKELAIQFGIERGLSANEVIQMGNEKKLDVLDNKHNSEHGSNANGIPLIEMKSDKLRDKVINQIKK